MEDKKNSSSNFKVYVKTMTMKTIVIEIEPH